MFAVGYLSAHERAIELRDSIQALFYYQVKFRNSVYVHTLPPNPRIAIPAALSDEYSGSAKKAGVFAVSSFLAEQFP